MRVFKQENLWKIIIAISLSDKEVINMVKTKITINIVVLVKNWRLGVNL